MVMQCNISDGVNRCRYAIGTAWFETQQKLFADSLKHILRAAFLALHLHLAIHQNPFKKELSALFASVFAILHTVSISPPGGWRKQRGGG